MTSTCGKLAGFFSGILATLDARHFRITMMGNDGGGKGPPLAAAAAIHGFAAASFPRLQVE
jgi:hypothetical protein